MPKIKLLDKNLINQIAAGEVVERPASVVKELLENAIDAKASRIEIEISNSCRNIRISDNGHGISKEDIPLAFSKHATSKISTQEDLYNINSLGFRGEALASLISIAKVTCITKEVNSEFGIKAICENSEIKMNEVGCANGTTFEVEDLFYNVAARLKFLKNEKTELAYITELTQAIAISVPSIAITLKYRSNNLIQTLGSGSLINTIAEIYNNDTIEHLLPLEKIDELSHLKVSGFVSNPTYTRSSKKSIYIFVNNRIVKCPILQKVISNIYKNLIPIGKYPFIVLNLNMPTADVDVNVHPTKQEVRYKNPNQIFNFVYSAISDALNTTLRQEETIIENKSSQNSFELKSPVVSNPIETVTQTNFYSQFSQNILNKENIEEDDCVYVSQISNKVLDGNTANIRNSLRNLDKKSSSLKEFQHKIYSPLNVDEDDVSYLPQQEKSIKIIGQLSDTYILIENENDMEIIDQHIAHERYLYEKLKAEKQIASQGLLFSDVVQLEPSDYELLKDNNDKLEFFGYKIEFLKNNEITFKKLPYLIANYASSEIVSELLEEIHSDNASIEEKILISMSCKAAIKANTKLSYNEMLEIVKNWKTTAYPMTCPHGRPISKKISKKEIANFFLRSAT